MAHTACLIGTDSGHSKKKKMLLEYLAQVVGM
jgi:hypothetical protein